MRYIRHKMNAGEAIFGSCTHIGNPAMHEEGVAKFGEITRVKPWMHFGDLIESILPIDSRRYSQEEHGNDPLFATMDRVNEIFGDSAPMCIGLLTGNHENGLSRIVGNVTKKLARGLGVPFLTMSCFCDFIFTKGKCRGFFTHGGTTFNYVAGEPERIRINRQIKLRNYLRRFEADIKGIGHAHRKVIAPQVMEEKLTIIDGKIKRRPIHVKESWCFAAPAMFKTYDTKHDHGNYGEMKNYDPTDIGWIGVLFEKDGKIACIRQYLETGKIKEEVEPMVID